AGVGVGGIGLEEEPVHPTGEQVALGGGGLECGVLRRHAAAAEVIQRLLPFFAVADHLLGRAIGGDVKLALVGLVAFAVAFRAVFFEQRADVLGESGRRGRRRCGRGGVENGG